MNKVGWKIVLLENIGKFGEPNQVFEYIYFVRRVVRGLQRLVK